MAIEIYECFNCGKRVKKIKYYCVKCWREMPWEFQEDIFLAWDKDLMENDLSSAAMTDALTAATEWLRIHVTPPPHRRKDGAS